VLVLASFVSYGLVCWIAGGDLNPGKATVFEHWVVVEDLALEGAVDVLQRLMQAVILTLD